MNKNIIPTNFTLPLAIFDALPVLFFCSDIIILGSRFHSILFIIGGILCAFAGLSKVIWKIIVVLKQKNIWFLYMQMRTTMPLGFVLILISLFVNRNKINFNSLKNGIISKPQNIFFIIGCICMILMFIFAFTLNGADVKHNWIEQIINCIAQLCFMVGIIIAL
ncbi:MAG: hypothetical protein Q4E33_04400 [Erysipelotrichaceae bacterium]|nr:hypothetical protein [Erysipelotrichaceae bacterium]